MNWFRIFLIPCAIMYVPLAVPVAFGQQYAFLPVPGGPRAVKALFQDSQGRLWMRGEQSGPELACFDGTRFFDLREYGFPSVETNDIAEDSSGAIWIGAETGVYRFSHGRVEQINQGFAVSVIPATPDVVVAAMGPLSQVVPAQAALVRIERAGANWKTETVMSLESAGPLTLDHFGKLLYPYTSEQAQQWTDIPLEDVLHWRPGIKITGSNHGPRDFPFNGQWNFMRDRFGCLWSGSDYDCGHGRRPALAKGLNSTKRHREAANGEMLLSDDTILALGRPGAFRVATRANGLPDVSDAIPARDGTVWLGTANGLYRFASPFQVEYWTIRDGIVDPPFSFARVGPRIYAGLRQRIVALNKDRQRWETVTRFEGGGLVSGLLGAADGTLFATFIQAGAAQLRTDGTIIARTNDTHLDLHASMRLASTPNGETWMGGWRLGLLTRSGSTLQLANYAQRTTPSGNFLAIKYEEHTRKLWACYNGGLVLRDEQGKWREFTSADGLKVNDCWSLAALPSGDVWYAYRNAKAIALIRPAPDGHIKVQDFGPSSGIPEPGSVTMDADKTGRLWRGGELGAYVADPSQAESGNWLQLDESDGFPANGMNTGSVFVDADGSMWWGADNDLAHYMPPRDLVSPQFAPQVFVSAFSWENHAPKLAEAIGNLPNGSKVVAHIGSLQFDRRNALRLRYRLLPEETSWHESRSLDLPLGSLSAGDHTLEVQGRVFTGPWSHTVSWSFSVLRPFWATWPFLLGFVAAGTATGAGVYRRRRRRKIIEQRVLPDLTALRADAMVPEAHGLIGNLLDGRFLANRVLARGGFATVFEGLDRKQNRRCAIKVFHREVADNGLAQRFAQEVAALESVKHENVVRIYGHGETRQAVPYLVMEFVEGQTLREAIPETGLPVNEVARLLREAGQALGAIHARGICHRDLKPDNLMIRAKSGELVLIDFSIAIVKSPDKTVHGLSKAAGTIQYMAPEQAAGWATSASDIYSLAKVTMEMITGKRVSELLPDASWDLAVRAREMLVAMKLGLSAESIEMMGSALEFDPGRRPNNAVAFAEKIAGDLEGDLRSFRTQA